MKRNYMEHADKETQKKLIDAYNLICEHVSSRLPGGFWISIDMEKDDASIELIDPNGRLIDREPPDYGVSVIDDMCVTAEAIAYEFVAE